MGRIPEEAVRSVKVRVRLEEVVRRSGVSLAGGGEEVRGCCPFPHGSGADETPSLFVNVVKQLFHCHGCGVSGDVIGWVQQRRKLGFRRAFELLAEHGEDVMTAPAVEVDHLVRTGMTDGQVLDAVSRYYAEAFERNAEGREYAEKRGIYTPELADRFRYGFCDRTLGFRLPHRASPEGRHVRAQLATIGILHDSGHEAMRGCLTVCTTDDAGGVVAMYGRKVHAAQRDAVKHMYLKGPHRGVFNQAGMSGQAEVVLCESIIDALTFMAAGITNVTTAYGVDGLTDETVQALTEHQVKRVLIAYDRDDPGDRGAAAVSERLMALGMECLRVKFPRGMDVNGYARKVTPASESLRLVLKAAEWMGTGSGPVPVMNAAAAAEPPPTPAVLETPPSLPPLPTPQPAATTADILPPMDALEADEHHFRFGDRRYRVRGLRANTSHGVLKVNIGARVGSGYFVDTVDLMLAKARLQFSRMAGVDLGVDEKLVDEDVRRMLERLEALRDARIEKLKEGGKQEKKAVKLTEADTEEALELLKDPHLMERVASDLRAMGLVGEKTNKLVCYAAAVSRKLPKPLAIIIRSVSGAGKSSLMEGILSLMPEEEIQKYSAMTSQSLYYVGERDLCHKILALAEEEGAEKASYALKLLQSEGELTIASTGKDPVTGRHETKEYHVEGPVMVMVTTTAADPDEEFLNRCMVLSVDESREQTRAIHQAQRLEGTEAGILQRLERGAIIRRHRNAQRLLKPLAVENPWSAHLTFPDHQTRTRRDLPKYLRLIEAITLLFQYQRERKELISRHGEVVDTLVATLEDIALANALAVDVIGQTLDDMQPQTRRLLGSIHEMVGHLSEQHACKVDDVRFTQREVREYTGWGHTQLKVHLGRLVDREFLIVHRAGPGQRYVYELFYDGRGLDGRPFVNGLCDVEKLRALEAGGARSGGGRGGVGAQSAPADGDPTDDDDSGNSEK